MYQILIIILNETTVRINHTSNYYAKDIFDRKRVYIRILAD